MISISVPSAWKTLLQLPDFNLLPEMPAEWRENDKSPEAIAAHVTDINPWRDDSREVTLVEANRSYTATLNSGNSNYFLSLAVYEKEPEAADFADAVEMSGGDLARELPAELMFMENGSPTPVEIVCRNF